MNPSGIARAEINVIDISVLIDTGLKGITGVIGVTERGPIEPTLVGSVPEYERIFGGLLSTSIFPLLCQRALERGAKLKISRYQRFTESSNVVTPVGVKASGSKSANSAVVLTYEAVDSGTWANGLKVTLVPAASGNIDRADIQVSHPSADEVLNYVVRDVDMLGNSTSHKGIVDFNTRSRIVKIKTITQTLKAILDDDDSFEVTLASGAYELSEYTTDLVDWIGRPGQKNGLSAFDNDSEITRIAIPALAIPELDTAISAYAERRGDILAFVRTPMGVDGKTAVDYRMRTGAYADEESTVPINSWKTFMFTGDLVVTNPLNTDKIEIPAIGDILGIYSSKDSKSKEWFAGAGSKRGRIGNVLGVVNNLGSAAQAAAANDVDAKGLNMVINHPSFGVVAWGNGTLHRENTLLKHANVAELLMFLVRGLKPIIESELFEPNDIETWQAIYRKADPFLDAVKTGRGMWDYKYQGDQDIDDISQAKINTPANIDAGKYVIRLFVKPKVAMKYIGLQIAVTNSGTSFEVLTETPFD